jgi:hypothetical protein
MTTNIKQFNTKINTDGTYREFHGWSVISHVKVNNNHVLARFFSPLPYKSYHVTLYNIWANGNPLLPYQKRFIDINLPLHKKTLYDCSAQIGYFNPIGCIDKLLYKIHHKCLNTWESSCITLDPIRYNGNTLRFSVSKQQSNLSHLNNIRHSIENVCEHNDGMGEYHITLGYKFMDITKKDKKDINTELCILNKQLRFEQPLQLEQPFVCRFSDMTMFDYVFNKPVTIDTKKTIMDLVYLYNNPDLVKYDASPNGNRITHIYSDGEITSQKGGYAYLRRSTFVDIEKVCNDIELTNDLTFPISCNGYTYAIVTPEHAIEIRNQIIRHVQLKK